MKNLKKAYIVGVNPDHSFKPGVPGEILGFNLFSNQSGTVKKRPTFKVLYHGSEEALITLNELQQGYYQFCSFDDIISGNVPKIETS